MLFGEKPLHREPIGWKEVEFSQDELVVVEELLHDEELNDDMDFTTATRILIMKFGWRLDGGEGPMILSDEELWLLREVIPTSLRTPSYPQLGLELKKKIYSAILAIDRELIVSLAKKHMGINEVEDDKPNQDPSEDSNKKPSKKSRKKRGTKTNPTEGDAIQPTVPRPEGEGDMEDKGTI